MIKDPYNLDNFKALYDVVVREQWSKTGKGNILEIKYAISLILDFSMYLKNT